MKNFLEAGQLDQLDDLVILDVRFNFTDPEAGKKQYDAGHLEGAFYLSLNEDLSSLPTGESGNHPMPLASTLKSKLESLGISNKSHIVVYDDGSNSVVGRAWFVLKYLGLENVQVLNGGFSGATSAGLVISREIPVNVTKGHIEIQPDESLLVTYDEVLAHVQKPEDKRVLVDSRAMARFQGREEHLYAVAGHIPGAVNLEFSSSYDGNGRIRSREELIELFLEFKDKEDIILSCGSGVSALGNFIAMDEIGLNPRLYVGSYSQWLEKGNEVE